MFSYYRMRSLTTAHKRIHHLETTCTIQLTSENFRLFPCTIFFFSGGCRCRKHRRRAGVGVCLCGCLSVSVSVSVPFPCRCLPVCPSVSLSACVCVRIARLPPSLYPLFSPSLSLPPALLGSCARVEREAEESELEHELMVCTN